MLSSSSQYLHPDYLHPLPTTLDAKKSPLALLAQTCSSIGKDSSSSSSAKSLIPPIERKDVTKDKETSSRPKSGADTPRTKSRDSSDRKSQVSPATKKPAGSPAPKDLSKPTSRSTPNKSPCHSPASKDTRGECRSRDGTTMHPTSSSPSEAVDSKPLSASQPFSAAHRADALASSLYAPFGMPYPGYPYPLLGHPLGLEASACSTHPGLASKHAALGWPASGVPPYVGYTRVKSSTGASSLVPVCKDPSCNHCQSNGPHSAQSSGCTAGCTQCTHDKTPTSLVHTAAMGGLPFYPPGALGASPSSLHALSSLYAAGHPYGMLPGAAQGLPPFVCNWVAGSDYCGKRFASSEELLQHLRTHTSVSDPAAALSLAGLPYGGLGGFPGLPSPMPPSSLSPDSALRQAAQAAQVAQVAQAAQAAHYPHSLSPSSLLAASRFHPYKSALSSLASPPSAAGLAQYYSPLSLYGQRLGAAAP